QGDVLGIVNASGTQVVAYTYDAWGKVLTKTGSMAATLGSASPFRYRGYVYDEETGLYYLQSRYYNPSMGRFINADSNLAGVGGDVLGYNLFVYCHNNPVNMSDSTGHWPQWIKNAVSAVSNAVKKAVGAVVNSVKSAISSLTKQASNIVKANSLPKAGDPGSSKTLPNPDGTPKQKRWYGPDGNAERDRDYNHPGEMPFPHDHEWRDGIRQPGHLPPDPSYDFSWEPVLGVGLVAISVIGVAWVAGNDVTGVGVADDFLLGPLGGGVRQGFIMIFG
ncbi:MAG: RHS repeat-associated core domain-containing protein, partial [Clostridiales bacterium]|nr:RHS repeat-associated core domain-containing protein [Clostridiales bacterium]